MPVLAVSHVDGTVVDERADAEALSPAARHAIGLSLVDTLGRIHGVDLEAVGLADLASHKPYAARQLKRWSGQWELSRTRELPELERLTARLEAEREAERTVRRAEVPDLDPICVDALAAWR